MRVFYLQTAQDKKLFRVSYLAFRTFAKSIENVVDQWLTDGR
jgi:hypothetical protein